MHLPVLSANLIIIAVIAAGLVYGLIGGKHRLKLLILSIYVGIVLATQFAAVVVSTLHQPVDLVTLGLFGLPIILFGFSGRGGGKHEHNGTMLANLGVGLAAGALVAASGLKLLPPSEAASLGDNSLVISLLMHYQPWLLALLPLAALVFGFMKVKEHKR